MVPVFPEEFVEPIAVISHSREIEYGKNLAAVSQVEFVDRLIENVLAVNIKLNVIHSAVKSATGSESVFGQHLDTNVPMGQNRDIKNVIVTHASCVEFESPELIIDSRVLVERAQRKLFHSRGEFVLDFGKIFHQQRIQRKVVLVANVEMKVRAARRSRISREGNSIAALDGELVGLEIKVYLRRTLPIMLLQYVIRQVTLEAVEV